MINAIPKWSFIIHLFIEIRVVNLQFPMFAMPHPMPQIIAIPPPPPIAFPVPIPIHISETTTTSTTTTTTTEQNMGIAVPFPMPLPIQIAIPAMPPPSFCQAKQRPNNCPPCPPCVCSPSCTPAFFSFCSPCHQKCRCRNPEDVPKPLPPRPPQPVLAPAFPMPIPMPSVIGPPPLVVLPYPERKSRDKRPWNRFSTNEETSSSSSSENDRRSGRRNNKRINRRRMRNSRRNGEVEYIEESEGEFVKPVLTYISKDGEVKIKRRISSDVAAQLLGEGDSGGKPFQTVKVIAGQNAAKQSQVLVVSDDGEEPQVARRHKQVVLRGGASQHIIGEGKKELVFRPPDDKKISNLSVSFQVLKK